MYVMPTPRPCHESNPISNNFYWNFCKFFCQNSLSEFCELIKKVIRFVNLYIICTICYHICIIYGSDFNCLAYAVRFMVPLHIYLNIHAYTKRITLRTNHRTYIHTLHNTYIPYVNLLSVYLTNYLLIREDRSTDWMIIVCYLPSSRLCLCLSIIRNLAIVPNPK